MASSLIPDPLELLRRALTQVENRANAVVGRGLQADPVAKALHQLLALGLTSRRVRQAAMDGAIKALNLPTHGELAELRTSLRRIEDKLDRLLPEPADVAPRPPRTRRAHGGAAAPPADPAPPAPPRAAAKPRARTRR